MCRELDALRQSVLSYAAALDVEALTPGQAGTVVRLCAQIEASVSSVKALAAARCAEGKAWESAGFRSAADQLAHDAGMSPTAAKRTLETGRRMAGQPEVASAALAGQLSAEQAAVVADGVAAEPAKAAELVDKAGRLSLPELNEEVARVKAAVTDQEQRRAARQARRSLRRWSDRDGAMQAHMYGHPEDGAALWRALDPLRRRLNVLRREAGRPNESFEALDYDALMALALVATGKDAELNFGDLLELGLFPQANEVLPAAAPSTESAVPPRARKKLAGSPLRVMVRVDLGALIRDVPLEGELCDVPGYGPVPVSVVKDLLATENPFIIGVLTKGEAVTGVYHHGRRPNAHQRSALDFLYPTCAVEGCSSTGGLQYDHREDFARNKLTAFDLLDRLCPHHHRLKTNQGWALVEGRGKRAFAPPGDPRRQGPTMAGARDGPAPPAGASAVRRC